MRDCFRIESRSHLLYGHGSQSAHFEAVQFGEDFFGSMRRSGVGRTLVSALPGPLLVGCRAATLDVLRPFAVQEPETTFAVKTSKLNNDFLILIWMDELTPTQW